MKIVITGGAGFIGSHVSEFYAKSGHDVWVYDNLSRFDLLKKDNKQSDYNWKYLQKFSNVKSVKGDVRDFETLQDCTRGADVIVHTAAQTAVTSSVEDPRTDYSVNSTGTFNVLESARKNDVGCVLFTSTNKVYGDNVNKIGIVEGVNKYEFEESSKGGISEEFSIDNCKHTPYGVSKLCADIYAQDYSLIYGIKTGVFRMSCIYGTRQFGVEDQGWVVWLTIAAILGKPITIYGDGKQVRDVLFVSDLVRCFDNFIKSNHKNIVVNLGGGSNNTLSLLELIKLLEGLLGKKIRLNYSGWRPSDQKVYVSNIKKVGQLLNWSPQIRPEDGVKKVFEWVNQNQNLF